MENPVLRYFGIALCIITAIVLLWDSNNPTNEGLVNSGKDNQSPDAYIHHGKISIFNKNGRLSTTLSSNTAELYPDKNQGVIVAPRVTVFQEDGTPWNLTSNKGTYFVEKEQLQLAGNVEVIRGPSQPNPLRLTTEILVLHNTTRFITTDQPVKITDGISTLTGTGMNAWVNEKKIELTSDVRGIYAKQ